MFPPVVIMSAAAASSPNTLLHVIIRSTCMHDINQAKQFDLWASTPEGNDELKEFFLRRNTTVILYFTLFQSDKFCGVAKMAMAPFIRSDLKEYQRPVWQQSGWGKGLMRLKWLFAHDENYEKELEGVTVKDRAIIPEARAKLVLAKFVRSNNLSVRDFRANPLLERVRIYSSAKRAVDITTFFKTAEEPPAKRPKT